MIRIYSKDLVSIECDGIFYYSLLLDKIKYFGGHLSYVFYYTSNQLVDPDVVLKENNDGFLSIVDYIWAKREDRIQRIAKKVDIEDFEGPGFYKNTHRYEGKAPQWWIFNGEGEELFKVTDLNERQKQYPLLSRIDDIVMIDRVKEEWSILDDPRL
ncbi:hypothetical protein [Bermanella sp. R86510]|uniref:hypothetical protein n=1 Tax=unclassified Bermanella TaxID=2627862 RepID=UPI0037CA54BE